MTIQDCKVTVDKGNIERNRCTTALCLVLCVLILPWPLTVLAQTETPVSAPEPVDLPVNEFKFAPSLPGSQRMATSLATPELRRDVLLDLAVAMNLKAYRQLDETADSAALAQKFVQDRGWLARLVERYGWVNPHSAILDPAAWLLLGELQQHELPTMALVYPDHTPQGVLVHQVFQRSKERLAAANLPILLHKLEAGVIPIWDEFLTLIATDADPALEWKAVETEWFSHRKNPLIQMNNGDLEAQTPLTEDHLQKLSQLALSAVDSSPPDASSLKELRFSLYNEIPGRGQVERLHDTDILHLASLFDGLQDGRYFEFVRGLLSVTSGLLEHVSSTTENPTLVDWLVAELPAISAHYAADFAMVDPRLNAAMSTAYNVLQNMVNGEITVANKASRNALADAVAQMDLLIPDMGYYFDTPVRDRIAEEINVCTSIAASRDDLGYPAMTRRQFDACIENLLQLADQETRLAELSGSFSGPFRTDSLQRELSVTPAQRINYHIGYLHNRYSTDCPRPENNMPNPLEWAVLATAMAWFAEHSPEYFMTPENESRLTKMRAIGEQLILDLAEQAACFSGDNINDPVNRIMADYETALRQLDAGIAAAEADFREQRLRPGADISLDQDAAQKTGYRPEDLVIKPCDQSNVCEMSGDLVATRALIGLFPEQYLVAEQSGMGQIEICYRNMEWVKRRSELVRPDDENVANYFGHLGFDLVGRYIEDEDVSDLFAFRFTTPEEHHYLFAQASEEVLQDSCPVEWVGTRVITPLREDRGGIVPNRLTYLAASRTLPSRLLQGNWDRGTEWRDWFVTGIGVSALEVPPTADIKTRLSQHLESLYQAQQAEIYKRVLLPNARNAQGDDVSLFEEMSQVSIAKALMRMQIMLFYPESLARIDSIRMAVAGDAGLLERRTLRRFKEDDVAFALVNQIAGNRLRSLHESWSAQAEAVRREGSIPASLMHAMTRINALYRHFFTSIPEPLEEVQIPMPGPVRNPVPDPAPDENGEAQQRGI